MFEIVGYEQTSFPDKNTGELVTGFYIHLLGDEIQSRNGKGHCVLSKFFNQSRIIGELEVGKIAEFIIHFNNKGEAKVFGIKIS